MAPNNGIVSYNYGNGDWLDFEGAQGATPSTRPILHVVLDGGTAVDFQRGVSPAPSYDQVQEAVIALALDPRFFSQDTHHVVSGTNEYASTAGLIRFELPVVPPWVSVTSAALTFWVYFPSPAPHPVYESLRPWTEAATFLTYDGTAGRTGHRGRWRARLEPLGARRAPGGRLDRAAGLLPGSDGRHRSANGAPPERRRLGRRQRGRHPRGARDEGPAAFGGVRLRPDVERPPGSICSHPAAVYRREVDSAHLAPVTTRRIHPERASRSGSFGGNHT